MSKNCPLCRVSESPSFDALDTDAGLAAVIEHYLDEHPKSEHLQNAVHRTYVDRNCDDCGQSFWAVTRVNTGARGEIIAEAYCPECEQENFVRGLVVANVSPLEYVQRTGDPFEDDLQEEVAEP
jgi:hypothetical protein